MDQDRIIRVSKMSRPNERKAGTAEAAAGATVMGAGISNRVPGTINWSYNKVGQNKLKSWQKKQGNLRGVDAEGNPVNPKTLSNKPVKVGTRAEKFKQDARIADPSFQSMSQPEKRKVYQDVHRTWQEYKEGKGPRPQEVDVERTVDVRESPRSAARKAFTTKQQKLNRHATKTLIKPRTKASWGLTTIPVVAGGAMTWHGLNRRAEPVAKADRRDINAAAAGAAGTAAAYTMIPNKIESRMRRTKWEPKIADSPKLRQMAHDHQVLQGVKQHPTPEKHPSMDSKKWKFIDVGDRRWIKYNRSLPDALPGAKVRRTMSYTHAGKTGIAATGAVAAAGGYGALKMDRKHRSKNADH